jgi:hypothetical protein
VNMWHGESHKSDYHIIITYLQRPLLESIREKSLSIV